MEIGLLVRYGRIVPGRETQAIELWEEAQEYIGEKLSKGEITFYEPFFLSSSDAEVGFHLIKGPAPEIFRLVEEERYRALMTKTALVVEFVRTDVVTVGEGIAEQLERFAKARAELGF